MAYNKQSIISKIAKNGVITPYETICLQYMNKLYIRKQTPDIEQWENPYIAVDNIPELYKNYDLDHLLYFKTIEDAHAYNAYRWAANAMSKFDGNIGELGYKSLAILSELKYFRSEYVCLINRNNEQDMKTETTLLDFSAYSQIYQQKMTFKQLMESFTDTFNFLLSSIDNILTLNYYLKTMAEPEELNCLKLLKAILAEEQIEEDEKEINIARVCYEQILNINLENNHKNFTEFMKSKLSESFNRTLEVNFQEASYQYVKKVLSDFTQETTKSQ